MCRSSCLFALTLLAACGGASGPAPVTPDLVRRAQANSPSATEASLTSGREAFVSRCKSCHELPKPSAHAAAEWPALMQRMGKLASLDAAAQQQVLDYVLAARE